MRGQSSFVSISADGIPIRCFKKGLLWLVPPMVAACLGIAVGPLSGFDLLNLRWMSGWVAVSGADGLNGSVAALLRSPWLHDGAVSLLLAPGLWWLGPAVLGALHGLLVPLSYECIRLCNPTLSRMGTTLLACTGLLTPLALMHIGRETGHLLAGAVLAFAVRDFLANPEHGARIGLFVGIVPLVKVSAGLSALILGLAFLLGLRGRERLRFAAGVAGVVWFGALVPSLFLRIRIGRWSEIPIWGQLFPVGGVILISLSVLVLAWLAIQLPQGAQSSFRASWLSPLVLVIGTWITAIWIRGAGVSDPRFLPPSQSDLIRQLFMAGNAYAPTRLSDWEVLYVDNSRMLLVLLSIFALFLFLRPSSTYMHQRMLLVAVAIGASVVLIQSTFGYVRYASQSIALVPIAIGCVIGLSDGRRLWREVFVLSLSATLLLPTIETDLWFRAPGLKAYGQPTTLLVAEEPQLLNSLLPADSAVFLFGQTVRSAAPASGRTDIKWFLKPLYPEDIGFGAATLLYDPAVTRDLDKFSTRNWRFEICQTLRFENVSYGWCAMKAV